MALNERGHEVPDPTPLAVPVGFRHPPSMQEMIKQYIRRELSEQASQAGAETLEEANDFDIPDGPPDPYSKWEHDLDPPELPPQEPTPSPGAHSSAPGGPAPAGPEAVSKPTA